MKRDNFGVKNNISFIENPSFAIHCEKDVRSKVYSDDKKG